MINHWLLFIFHTRAEYSNAINKEEKLRFCLHIHVFILAMRTANKTLLIDFLHFINSSIHLCLNITSGRGLTNILFQSYLLNFIVFHYLYLLN